MDTWEHRRLQQQMQAKQRKEDLGYDTDDYEVVMSKNKLNRKKRRRKSRRKNLKEDSVGSKSSQEHPSEEEEESLEPTPSDEEFIVDDGGLNSDEEFKIPINNPKKAFAENQENGYTIPNLPFIIYSDQLLDSYGYFVHKKAIKGKA